MAKTPSSAPTSNRSFVLALAIVVACVIIIPFLYTLIGLGGAWIFNLFTEYPRGVQKWQVITFGGVALGVVAISLINWLNKTQRLVPWSVGIALLPPILLSAVSILCYWFDNNQMADRLFSHRYDSLVVSIPCAAALMIAGVAFDLVARSKAVSSTTGLEEDESTIDPDN